MNDVTAKSLLIQLQCTNKDITEAQNDALSYVISFLDEIVSEVDRGNYGMEKHMIKKVHPEYSDKEVEAYIKGYEEKELEIRDKANEDKAKGTGLKLMPTEVEGLYLNIPEEVEEEQMCDTCNHYNTNTHWCSQYNDTTYSSNCSSYQAKEDDE